MKQVALAFIRHRFHFDAVKYGACSIVLLCLLTCQGCKQSTDEGSVRLDSAPAAGAPGVVEHAPADPEHSPTPASVESGAAPVESADRPRHEVSDESATDLERGHEAATERALRNSADLEELRNRLREALAAVDVVTARLDRVVDRMSSSSQFADSQRSWIEKQAAELYAAQRDIELATLRIIELEQSLVAHNDRIVTNAEAIAGADAYSELQQKRLDSLAHELALLANQLQGHSQSLERQGARIDANGARNFESLMALDAIQLELASLQQAQRLVELAVEAQAVKAAKNLGAAWPSLLTTITLCLLVPLAIVVNFGDSDGRARGGHGEPRRTVGTLAAWFGGGAGFYLIGIGIVYGSSLGGISGSPAHFLTDVLQDAPADLPAALLSALLLELSLAAIVAVVVCSVLPQRTPSWAYLFAALVIGGIVYPLFGHWTATPSPLSEHAGWLTSAGFAHPPAAPNVALLGGATAIFLSRGLLPLTAPGLSRAKRPGGTDASIVSAMLLWLGWIGVIGAASNASPNAPLLLAALAAAAAGAAFGVLIFAMAFSAHGHWLSGFPFSVLAALVAAPGGVPGATLTELILLGALTGVSASFLMATLDNRLSAKIKLAAALMSGGLLGTLAPALFGPAGFVFTLSFEPLITQMQGIGVALALALVAGQTLASTINRTTKLRAPS